MTVLLFIGIVFLIYALASVVFFGGHVFKRGTLPPFGAIIFILFFVLMLLIIVRAWTNYFIIIKIDTITKTISFKNIFTRQTFHYNFHDVDGYLDIFASTKNGNYKVLYLVRDKKAVQTITGYYYANIDEMQGALSSMTYFGLQQNWRPIARRALFNKPIMD
jgi:hypothetical protein